MKARKDTIDLSWADIQDRAKVIADQINNFGWGSSNEPIKIYGIPRGGVYAAQAVLPFIHKKVRLVESPELAQIFIDDIIDSGNTKRRYQRIYSQTPENPFYALVDSIREDAHWQGLWISFPWERMINDDGPEENIVRILEYIGEDPEREGLKETPERVIRSYKELYSGYKQNPSDIIKVFDDPCDEIVLVKNIEFYSTCEHHLLPFFGKAHIAYIPNGKVIGVSKLARILEIYARRLQIQERIGEQVTEVIDNMLTPLGVACVLEAQHFCMTSRGVQKQNSIMVTSSLTGAFKEKPEARAELLSMIRG